MWAGQTPSVPTRYYYDHTSNNDGNDQHYYDDYQHKPMIMDPRNGVHIAGKHTKKNPQDVLLKAGAGVLESLVGDDGNENIEDSMQQQHRNILVEDDDAFFQAANTLLSIHVRTGNSPQHILFQILTVRERHLFAEAFNRRYRNLSTFPVPGEETIHEIMRRVNNVFGSLLQQQQQPQYNESAKNAYIQAPVTETTVPPTYYNFHNNTHHHQQRHPLQEVHQGYVNMDMAPQQQNFPLQGYNNIYSQQLNHQEYANNSMGYNHPQYNIIHSQQQQQPQIPPEVIMPKEHQIDHDYRHPPARRRYEEQPNENKKYSQEHQIVPFAGNDVDNEYLNYRYNDYDDNDPYLNRIKSSSPRKHHHQQRHKNNGHSDTNEDRKHRHQSKHSRKKNNERETKPSTSTRKSRHRHRNRSYSPKKSYSPTRHRDHKNSLDYPSKRRCYASPSVKRNRSRSESPISTSTSSRHHPHHTSTDLAPSSINKHHHYYNNSLPISPNYYPVAPNTQHPHSPIKGILKNHQNNKSTNYNSDSSYDDSDSDFPRAETTKQIESRIRNSIVKEIGQVTQLLLTCKDDKQREMYIGYLNGLQSRLQNVIETTTIKNVSTNKSASLDNMQSHKETKNLERKEQQEGRDEETEEIHEIIPVPTDERDSPTASKNRKDVRMSSQTTVSENDSNQVTTGESCPRGASKSKETKSQSSSPQTIHVLAPETMPENYQFYAQTGERVFVATVPKGGVVKGQIFETTLQDVISTPTMMPETKPQESMKIPRDKWRDRLFSCFDHGIFHPSCLMSTFCPHVAVAQIMARMNLTGYGDRARTINSRVKVKTVLGISILIFALNIYFIYLLVCSDKLGVFIFVPIIMLFLDSPILYLFYNSVARTRKVVRMEYNIREECCGGFEDMMMSLWCTCCAIAQMQRHTADYETYRADFCSDTGLPNHINMNSQTGPSLEFHTNPNHVEIV